MPPRHAYWTIIAGGLPTAFRAALREDLLPTLRRLAATHPDAELKWFARGRLWSSPEAARQAPRASDSQRGPGWRPGGAHRDPRQEFKDAKKARNAARRRQRFARKQGQATPGPAGGAGDRAGSGRRPGPKPSRPPHRSPGNRLTGGSSRGKARPARGQKGGRRR